LTQPLAAAHLWALLNKARLSIASLTPRIPRTQAMRHENVQLMLAASTTQHRLQALAKEKEVLQAELAKLRKVG